jgi:glycosyltransferase involved in cell wall biosynthesis
MKLKLLLITESIPFPPRNGRELPTAKIFEELMIQHDVDVVVVGQDEEDFRARKEELPTGIQNVWYLPYRKLNIVKRMINELLLIKPAYFFRQLDAQQVASLFTGKHYDFAWVNPPGNLQLIELCRSLGIKLCDHSILGMNDLKTSLYADKMHQVRGGNFKLAYLIHWIRSFFIAIHEKKYLEEFDLVHVQTLKEKKKTVALMDDHSFAQRVIDSPNGVKEFLYDCEYKGIDKNAILFMTHLSGERKYESKWFITKVWPKILAKTDAELWLVGMPLTGPLSYVDNDERIKALGFVPDLLDTFNSVRLSVVPIFHGTGLINRIQDALAAGVPCVASQLAASTFPDAIDGEHLLVAEKAEEYADAVIRLYEDRGLRLSLSANGKQYAKEQPTWAETAARLSRQMQRIVQRDKPKAVVTNQ